MSWDAVSNYDGPIRRVQVVIEPLDAPTHNVARIDCSNNLVCSFGSYDQAKASQFKRAWVGYEKTFEEPATVAEAAAAAAATAGNGVLLGSETEPLQAGAAYTLRLLVCTSNAGIELCQASILDPRPADPNNPLVGSVAKTQAPPAADNSGVLVAVIIVLLLIIAAIAGVFFYRKHKAAAKPSDGFWGEETGTVPPSSGRNAFAQPIAPPRGQASNSVGLVPVHNSISGANPVAGSAPILPQKAGRGGAAAPAAIPGVPTLPPVERHDVSVSDLHSVIQQMSANSDFAFSEEYECIETGNEFPRTYALLDHNRMKNRFANILSCKLTSAWLVASYC